MAPHWPIPLRVRFPSTRRRVTAILPLRLRLHVPPRDPPSSHSSSFAKGIIIPKTTPSTAIATITILRTITSMSTAPQDNTTASPPSKRVKTSETNGTTMAEPQLLVKKLSDKARLPTRGSAFAAGYDLYAAKQTTVPARGKVLVSTDISIACPAGTYGRVAPRSGLASKNFIDTGAGVIDADYRGEVKVLLFNHAETDHEINEGDRIAQLVLERIYTPEVVEVQELEESVRGAGGFGSTG